MLICKRDTARELIKTGKPHDALKLMGKFKYKKTELLGLRIQSGREALLHPRMYEQLGQNPTLMVEDGLLAMYELLKV